ncbi:hypothetical protein IFVP18_C290001 [Vibrio parahaemolyticus]
MYSLFKAIMSQLNTFYIGPR